jgi:hypothetical protein
MAGSGKLLVTGPSSALNHRNRNGGSQPPPMAPTRLRKIADGLIDMERYTPHLQSNRHHVQLLN